MPSRSTAVILAALTAVVPAALRAQETVVRLEDVSRDNELAVLIGPVDLPAGGAHHGGAHGAVLPPVREVTFPFDAYLNGFRFDVVDADGNPVPSDVVHHLNLIDPSHRELFLPISQRMMAVGGETGPGKLPWLLVGVPVRAGQRMIVSIMLHNPTGRDYHGATVRFFWRYVKAGRPWPLFAIQPFQVDVAFPFGDKSFDLPPGQSSRSWEGKPAIPGRILAMGGHLHEHATRLAFEDVTTGEVIFDGRPQTAGEGDGKGMAYVYFFKTLGLKLDTAHTYRVVVEYDNPIGDSIPSGGMGVVAGAFLPGGDLPAADTTDFTYAMDRKHYLRLLQGRMDVMLAQLNGPAAAPRKPAPAEEHSHQH